ncbi:MAG: HAD hydrolase-like protein [Chloroflexi bacterium]|nr:HAD hydrolase-like protein [Chloroflexota bacterium]
MQSIAAELNLAFSDDELGSLAESLPNWPIFPDVAGALQTLKERYKLAVISNVDDDLFASTAKALNVDFDLVVTAQQVQSYKPDLRNFNVASAHMKVDKQNWLHVAESLYHDISPANQLGIKSVWVNRPNRGGGTRPTDAVPDVVVPDLAALTEILCRH